MKLSKERVSYLSKILVNDLIDNRYLSPKVPKEDLIERVDKIITDDLMVEDRLNHEVKEILKSREKEIEKGNVDYHKMFLMIKNKLVKERGLVL